MKSILLIGLGVGRNMAARLTTHDGQASSYRGSGTPFLSRFRSQLLVEFASNKTLFSERCAHVIYPAATFQFARTDYDPRMAMLDAALPRVASDDLLVRLRHIDGLLPAVTGFRCNPLNLIYECKTIPLKDRWK